MYTAKYNSIILIVFLLQSMVVLWQHILIFISIHIHSTIPWCLAVTFAVFLFLKKQCIDIAAMIYVKFLYSHLYEDFFQILWYLFLYHDSPWYLCGWWIFAVQLIKSWTCVQVGQNNHTHISVTWCVDLNRDRHIISACWLEVYFYLETYGVRIRHKQKEAD